MVPTFGIRLPCHPSNAIYLRAKILRSRFPFSSHVTSLYKLASSNCGRDHAGHCFVQVKPTRVFDNRKKGNWSIYNSADGRGLDPFTSNGNGRTRLIKAVQNLLSRLNATIQDLRKDLPRKLLFFLAGFYCATAFATVIGQPGDWDILSAALAVVVVEGIGALTYKASVPLLNKIRNLIVIFNYWKAGLALGLFLDSFNIFIALVRITGIQEYLSVARLCLVGLYIIFSNNFTVHLVYLCLQYATADCYRTAGTLRQ